MAFNLSVIAQDLNAAIAKANAAAPQSTTYTKSETDTLLAGKVDKETGKGLSTNDFTTAEKNKLSGIAAGAEVNVQANWAQTSNLADDFIKNKPTLGAAAAKGVDSAPTASSTNLVESGGVEAVLTSIATNCLLRVAAFDASGNFDEQTTMGIYRYNGSPLNHPTGDASEYGLLIVLVYGSYISQICHVFNPDVSGIYIRTSISGTTWSAWNHLTGTAVT